MMKTTTNTDGIMTENAITSHFKYRELNGGDLIERSLVCSKCDNWEGFYEDTDQQCAAEAIESGWKIRKGKVFCC